MPVGGVKMGEGPSDVGKTQPAGYVTGAINVIVIIVTDPIEVHSLPEDNSDQRGKREDDRKFLRLQTEAQTIHGGGTCESRVGARHDGRFSSLDCSTFLRNADPFEPLTKAAECNSLGAQATSLCSAWRYRFAFNSTELVRSLTLQLRNTGLRPVRQAGMSPASGNDVTD